MADHQVIINFQVYKLIPLGFCACGCGGKTNIETRNSRNKGYIKGEPRKYLKGHNNSRKYQDMMVERLCKTCGKSLNKHIYPSGRIEDDHHFLIRQHCSVICGSQNKGRGPENANWNGGKHFDGKYLTVYAPSHPRAVKKRIREHIIIAEKALGKLLPQKAEVHHFTLTQLVVCENRSYHMLLHQRQRALKSCGHAGWLKCAYCGLYDDPKFMYLRPNSINRQAWHKECSCEYKRKRR